MNRYSVLLIALLTTPVTADEPAFPLTARRILFLGDSITNSGYYVADIECQLRLQGLKTVPEMINLGLSSETCTGLSEPAHPFPRPNVHERLQRALTIIKPDVVVACYGMNDGIYHPFDQDRFTQYQRGLTKIVEDVHDFGAKIVVLTPPPFDPLPLRNKPGKLVPVDAEQFAWFAVFDGYAEVIQRYSDWVSKNSFHADMVIDIHSPISSELSERRRKQADFHVASDGVHMDETGHSIMARAILEAWGVSSWEPPSNELNSLMNQRQKVLHDAWLSRVGHKRPGVKPGLPIPEAEQALVVSSGTMRRLLETATDGMVDQRASTGGTVYSVHYPADLASGALKLNVDYHLWVPDGVETLRGVIVHQHGCGPGASLGGRTAADDLHWQELARRQQCALMGSSYEPRRGANCRLWCDARRGSAQRFEQALAAFADAAAHPELASAPWCLWGHSGGGFWSSLMQTMYADRIVAIWLQSGTAFGYWMSGEIPAPELTAAAFQVPVMAVPGLKEKTHERFHRAWDGSAAMVAHYTERGAPFIKMTADPRTSHECGDSRYLAIPFFDFWLSRRIDNESNALKPVEKKHITAWNRLLEPKRLEFEETGEVGDTSPPPAPTTAKATRLASGQIRVTWSARADFESGIRGFVLSVDGKEIKRVPEHPEGRFGRALFQTMSYHDTPEAPLPAFEMDIDSPGAGRLTIQTINSVGLISQPASVRFE
ncbi:MAG: SGNH/GDSL hydrolase family protein [Planctomycetaceae bacterium]|nr:SGNH/GDSL hydrolase family protein [Planctomycetaceae bacterium]